MNKQQVDTINVEPAFDIIFERGQAYGSTEDVYVVVGGASDYAKVDEKGHVFIPDREQEIIHVFDSNGKYHKSMGRRGKGPGEFVFMSTARMGPKYLYVYDSDLKRINVFSLDSLSFSHTMNLNPQMWKHIDKLNDSYLASNFFPINDNLFLMGFTPMMPAHQDEELSKKKNYYHYYLLRPGEKIKNVEIIRQSARKQVIIFKGRGSTRLDFHPKPLITVAQSGKIYSAWSEDFEIEVRDTTGQLVDTIKYALEKAPLSREELIERYDITGQDNPVLRKVREMDLPETWPALHSMQVDDKGRLWVSTIKEYMKVNQWWVLDKEGKLLARFDWPWDKAIQDIANGNIYVTERDKNDVARIVQYKFDFAEKP